jgi:hypothetical protein
VIKQGTKQTKRTDNKKDKYMLDGSRRKIEQCRAGQ